MKRICVFCASSEHISGVYHEAVTTFGHALADCGGSLLFGGGNVGLMGTVAKAVKEKHGKVYGVIPSYLRAGEGRFSLCDELIFTDTLAERKKHMIEKADGFAVLPGGYGTLDETFEILTLRRHNKVSQPVVFLNTGGFYDSLFNFLTKLKEEGFIETPFPDDLYVTAKPEEAARYITGSLKRGTHGF